MTSKPKMLYPILKRVVYKGPEPHHRQIIEPKDPRYKAMPFDHLSEEEILLLQEMRVIGQPEEAPEDWTYQNGFPIADPRAAKKVAAPVVPAPPSTPAETAGKKK